MTNARLPLSRLRFAGFVPLPVFAGAVGAVMAVLAVVSGCERSEPAAGVGPVGPDGWLSGDLREQLDTVAEHLGGMGDAMVRIGDRYIELHWAGESRNWQMAAHQLLEIEETLERALVRRPQYAGAAEMFFASGLPGVSEAIDAEDLDLFRQRFADLTVNCNACHMMTGYPFMRVSAPRERTKPWHWSDE